MDFQLGDVLQVEWSERPIRVLMTDDIETFYDALLPEIGWILARARTVVYFRIAPEFLGSRAERLRNEPLTEAERAKHRPDLPMRLLRTVSADWKKPLADWPKVDTSFKVECPRLALIPYGPKGAPLRPTFIAAANDCYFTGEELLLAAHDAQIAVCPEVEGIGLYRSGICSGIPSFYLWGAIDKAGHAG